MLYRALVDENNAFEAFGVQHWVVMVGIVVLSVALPMIGLQLSLEYRLLLARVMACCMSLSIVVWTAMRWNSRTLDTITDLPLDICNMMALVLPLVMWTPNLTTHEIYYFLALGGTFQAIITPDSPNAFPHISFLKYWIVHGGLVVFVIYMTVVFQLYPRWWGIVNTYLAVLAYVPFVGLLNWLLGTNYIYTHRKPPGPTALDYLGPWPLYLLGALGLGGILFVIVYIPILIFVP